MACWPKPRKSCSGFDGRGKNSASRLSPCKLFRENCKTLPSPLTSDREDIQWRGPKLERLKKDGRGTVLVVLEGFILESPGGRAAPLGTEEPGLWLLNASLKGRLVSTMPGSSLAPEELGGCGVCQDPFEEQSWETDPESLLQLCFDGSGLGSPGRSP